jgi:hypothetical protein
MTTTKVLDLGIAQPKQERFFSSKCKYTAFGGA